MGSLLSYRCGRGCTPHRWAGGARMGSSCGPSWRTCRMSQKSTRSDGTCSGAGMRSCERREAECQCCADVDLQSFNCWACPSYPVRVFPHIKAVQVRKIQQLSTDRRQPQSHYVWIPPQQSESHHRAGTPLPHCCKWQGIAPAGLFCLLFLSNWPAFLAQDLTEQQLFDLNNLVRPIGPVLQLLSSGLLHVLTSYISIFCRSFRLGCCSSCCPGEAPLSWHVAITPP